tara:strand:+ start:2112 stop:2516 length:405 start_codon:yes stop_codon:yes gene_type:complete
MDTAEIINMPTRRSLNELLDQDRELYFEIKELNAKVKKYEEQRKLLESEIQDAMEEQGIDKAAHGKSGVSLLPESQPKATDWDALYAYINESGDNHLIQKRLSSTACKEHIQVYGSLPGIEMMEFTKVKLSHKK